MNPSESAASMAMLPHEYRVMFEIEEEYWWYRGLRVLLQGLIAQYVSADGRAKILDAGCGTGKNLQILAQHGDAWGVDIAPEAIEFCRRRGLGTDRTLVASLLELPFPETFFDVAFSFDVICNIQHDVAAFREIRRTLKPDGYLIAQLPAYRFLWSAHDVAVGHKHRYMARDLRAKIEKAGFRVKKLTYLNMSLFPLIALLRFARRPAAHANARSDLTPLPRGLNETLARLFSAEMRVAPRHRFPFGISMLAVARRIE
ncbi:MAG: Ubiquinone/menaquinone biosynthesis C-methyltransferase UbiE [Anaerolineae bacterium]|nr:Ubiquinone/menaquinone biosynthesis C-methyltransferase UbiE [Anaerolineae bacterium]